MSSHKRTRAKTQTPASGSAKLVHASVVQPGMTAYYFNRFKIVRDEDVRIIYFGAVIDGELADFQAIAMVETDIAYCYQLSKAYIEGLGSVSQDAPKGWEHPRKVRLGIANILNFSHAGDCAELSFSNYWIHDLANARKGLVEELSCARQLVLRCSLDLHRQLLGHLFHGLTES